MGFRGKLHLQVYELGVHDDLQVHGIRENDG